MTKWLILALATAALACARPKHEAADTAVGDDRRADSSSAATPTASGDTSSPAPAPAAPDTGGQPIPPRGTIPRGEPAATRTPPRPAAGDSARGTVRLVGSQPVSVSVVLQPADGGKAIPLAGDETQALRQLGGVEVVVHGSPMPSGELDVSSFRVRAVNGDPAVDGILVADGTGLAIETGGSRRRLGNPPAALRSLVGSRVWITGPLETGPNVYGVIKG